MKDSTLKLFFQIGFVIALIAGIAGLCIGLGSNKGKKKYVTLIEK